MLDPQPPHTTPWWCRCVHTPSYVHTPNTNVVHISNHSIPTQDPAKIETTKEMISEFYKQISMVFNIAISQQMILSHCGSYTVLFLRKYSFITFNFHFSHQGGGIR